MGDFKPQARHKREKPTVIYADFDLSFAKNFSGDPILCVRADTHTHTHSRTKHTFYSNSGVYAIFSLINASRSYAFARAKNSHWN